MVRIKGNVNLFSTMKFKQIIELLPDCIIQFKPDFLIIFANRAFCDLLQVDEKLLIDTRLIAHLDFETVKHLVKECSKVTYNFPSINFEITQTFQDRTVKWFHWTVTGQYNEEEALTEYFAIGRNITKQKKIEAALQKSEEYYRDVINNQSDLIERSLPDTTLIFMNKAYAEYFNLTHEDIKNGKKFADFLPPENREEEIQKFRDLSFENPEITCVQAYQHPDGKTLWQQWNVKGIFNSEGKLQQYQSVGRDVTDLIVAQEKLKESEEKIASKNKELEEKNIALNEILEKLKERENHLSKDVVSNIENVVKPIINRLHNTVDLTSIKNLELLESAIDDILCPYLENLSYSERNLSFRELEICRLIQNGLVSKEIAEILGVSPKTIETHRNRIRKKLGLRNQKKSLYHYIIENGCKD